MRGKQHVQEEQGTVGKTDKQILWSLSYGSRADKEVLDKIRQALKGLKEEASGGR